MARTNFFVLLALLIALVPAVTADEAKQARIINRLAKKQADAAQRLENLLKTIDDLVVDLRSQGEKGKAELLEQAKAIVVGDSVAIDYQADAQGQSREELADLQRAMARLTKVLEQGAEHSAAA